MSATIDRTRLVVDAGYGPRDGERWTPCVAWAAADPDDAEAVAWAAQQEPEPVSYDGLGATWSNLHEMRVYGAELRLRARREVRS